LGSLPPEIGLLTQLKDLYLINNLLTRLPIEIKLLTRLEKLFLFGNPLTDELPVEIRQLSDLKISDDTPLSLRKRIYCLGNNLVLRHIPINPIRPSTQSYHFSIVFPLSIPRTSLFPF
jgi:Leucine-rich repeat (LRR) protein